MDILFVRLGYVGLRVSVITKVQIKAGFMRLTAE